MAEREGFEPGRFPNCLVAKGMAKTLVNTGILAHPVFHRSLKFHSVYLFFRLFGTDGTDAIVFVSMKPLCCRRCCGSLQSSPQTWHNPPELDPCCSALLTDLCLLLKPGILFNPASNAAVPHLCIVES